MEDLEKSRERWILERPLYEGLCHALIQIVTDACMTTGISCEVSGRVKEVDSFVKKLVLKPEKTYETIGDKAGIRVITKYLRDIELLLTAIGAVVDCNSLEDTAQRLGAKENGYRGFHLDVKLPEQPGSPYAGFKAELQVRTLGQHVWSEMAHDTVYKGADKFPDPLRRRIYLQAALLEIADEEFSRVSGEIESASGMEITNTLKELSRRYYMLTQVKYDHELSRDVLPGLVALYGSSEQMLQSVENYVQFHSSELKQVFEEQSHLPDRRSIYLFQPEVLAIVERLRNARRKTLRFFSERQEFKELERTATAFGISLE